MTENLSHGGRHFSDEVQRPSLQPENPVTPPEPAQGPDSSIEQPAPPAAPPADTTKSGPLGPPLSPVDTTTVMPAVGATAPPNGNPATNPPGDKGGWRRAVPPPNGSTHQDVPAVPSAPTEPSREGGRRRAPEPPSAPDPFAPSVIDSGVAGPFAPTPPIPAAPQNFTGGQLGQQSAPRGGPSNTEHAPTAGGPPMMSGPQTQGTVASNAGPIPGAALPSGGAGSGSFGPPSVGGPAGQIPPWQTNAPTMNPPAAPSAAWGQPPAPSAPPPASYGDPSELATGLGSIDAKALGSKDAVIEPKRGWRRGLYLSTFKLINPGESPIERLERDLRAQTARVITGTFIFAIYNPKGGSTKTTSTAGVGLTFADVRGTEVIVIDANPNKGKLAPRLDPTAQSNHQEMLRAVNSADEYHQDISQVRAHTGRSGDLDVLPGVGDDMENPVTYTPESLLETITVLRRKGYKVIGIDCGNSSTDPVTRLVLNIATALIVPAELRQDSVHDAKATFKWLAESGRAGLLGRSFLMLSDTMPKTSKDRLAAAEQVFEKTIWKEPIVVPFDPHLEPAGQIHLDQMQRETRLAHLKATAKLSKWYGLPPVPVVSQ